MIKKVFPILALSIFSSMLGVGIVAPLLPIYAENMGASGVWLGAIFAGYAVSRTVFMPIFARLSDKKGRKIFITIGLFAYALISLGYIWANSVFLLLIIRLLHGVAGGMILPIAQAYIGDLSPVNKEGKWMGYANAAFFSGFGFGPLMGGVLAEHLSMNAAFMAMGGLNLLAFFIALFFLPEVSVKKTAKAPRFTLKSLTASKSMQGLFIFRFAFAIGRAVFSTFLPIYAAIGLGISSTNVGLLLAIHILLLALLGIPMGRIADRFSRKWLVMLGGLVWFVFLVLIPQSYAFWQLLLLCIIGSLGGAISIPAASALVVEEGRKFGMGSAIAAFTIAFSLGMAIGPVLGGVISDFISTGATFYFGAASALAGVCLFALFTRKA